MTLWLVVTGLCVLGAAGCVSEPMSKQIRQEARATKDASFLTIWQNPATYRGRIVIWGGRILKTVNETNGEFISVLQAPLDDQERPRSTKLSQGRFIVRSSNFLDPEVYRTGAKITIAGELSGVEAQSVGTKTYSFPLVILRDVYFWRPRPVESSVYMGEPPWGWGWGETYQQVYDNYDGGYYSPGNYNPNFDRDWGGHFDHSR